MKSPIRRAGAKRIRYNPLPMLNRLRRLRISLAAKCQILFGAAVVLIISAALFVPWQRMEQLVDQIDRRAAGTLARDVVLRHVEHETSLAAGGPDAIPLGSRRVDIPATQPDGDRYFVPELVAAPPPEQMANLTPFQRNAIRYFRENPAEESVSRYYPRRDGQGFRYAQSLYAQGRCLDCHGPRPAPPAPPGPTSRPTGRLTARGGQLLGVVLVDIPSQVETNQLLLNRVFLLTAGLLAGVLAILVFYLIVTHLILQPVRVLQETAQKVSEGDLNIRSDINTGDEFQQLSETFNQMLTNLQRGEDQLRAANKSLDLKLVQLAEANVGLFESNRLKSEFLANVSHELRTPLNSILGFADLLKDAADDAKSQRYVHNILRSGQNLLDLINDLLDLAKIEAGKMEVRIEPVSMSDVFEGLTSLLKPLYEAKRLAIDAAVASEVPLVRTDAAKLQQILYNFLSNAIKFSPVEGTITVRASGDDGRVIRVSVTDQGPGIEPAHQQVIFEKFRQLDASVTREHGGSGLGLSISKELATLLGGAIGVVSTPGRGATFWLTLPLRPPSR